MPTKMMKVIDIFQYTFSGSPTSSSNSQTKAQTLWRTIYVTTLWGHFNAIPKALMAIQIFFTSFYKRGSRMEIFFNLAERLAREQTVRKKHSIHINLPGFLPKQLVQGLGHRCENCFTS